MKSKSTVEFGTFQRSNLSEQIAERIISMIKEQQLKPGDLLPPERELAETMGVSRPSLREALRALSIMNIIENRQGSGTYVASLEPERLIEHLDVVFSLDDSTFQELFEARRIIEVGIAGLAADMCKPEDEAELNSIHLKSVESVNDSKIFMDSDLELHHKILQITRNPILSLFMRSVTKLSIMSRKRTNEYPDVRQQTVLDHSKIIQAIVSHNSEEAKNAMKEHLDHVEKKLNELNKAKE
jgi:GntR family transcriptional regulator, transcriptional repressor for pyruvate dehydrogenase complex